MKQQCVCEKCGKVFEGENSWSNAYDCEESHRIPDVTSVYSDKLEYDQGSPWPKELVLGVNYHKDEDSGAYIYSSYATYRLVKPCLEATNQTINKGIIDEHIKDTKAWEARKSELAAQDAKKEGETV